MQLQITILANTGWNFDVKDRPSFSVIIDHFDRNQYNLIFLNKYEVKNVELFVKQLLKTNEVKYTEMLAKTNFLKKT